jgi:hypothetical protein
MIAYRIPLGGGPGATEASPREPSPPESADVDVTVRPRGSNDTAAFVLAMRDGGFDLRVADVDEFVRREEFIARARAVNIGGVLVPVLSPEDLIVTKVLAGREKDLEDIRGILRERGAELDLARMRSLLRLLEEALGQSDLLPLLEAQILAPRRTKADR